MIRAGALGLIETGKLEVLRMSSPKSDLYLHRGAVGVAAGKQSRRRKSEQPREQVAGEG